ncbi:glycosyl hydrolase family 18 protein [Francisella sp. 19X1-34]|uniref:glycosyl hydrolase family 18 protein n=1 Tax=Francisella sp. 19X1-34 TaxID=3087177 RepID=UPI003FA53091
MRNKMITAISYALMGLGSFTIAQASTNNNVETYDFKAPFKDYNNKIILNINNIPSAKTIEFITNFKPKAGWGNCFGISADLINFATTQNSKGEYITKMTLQDSEGSFDLTQSCDIMGTDSGNAVVLPGVVVPLVSSLKVDGKALEIERPCPGNVCKDPGAGYTNAAYYAQWAVWGRKYNPYDFKYDKLNTLIYAFVGFDKTTGNVKTLDASADSWGMSAAARAMKKYPYLKTYLSFGGWTNNGKTTAPMFEMLASDDSKMQNFASQSVELMRKLGFNGIDIDWEFWSDYGFDVAPAKKMLALYKVVRAELDKASKEDGKKYYLAIAVHGGRIGVESMQDPNNPNSVPDFWKQVGELMDKISIMSYDYQGAWGVGAPAYFQASAAFPNISHYGTSVADSIGKTNGLAIENIVDAFLENGVPANKIVAGIPLYARSMAVDSDQNGGLFQTITGAGLGDYEPGILDYKCVINPVNDPIAGCGSSKPVSGLSDLKFYDMNSNSDIFDKYGKIAMQPWAYSPSTKSFVTYDNVWSVTEKTKLVKSRGLGGTMFWQADGDSIDPSKSLIDAVAKVYASDTISMTVTGITENSVTLSWNEPELDGNVTYTLKLDDNVIAQNLTSQNYILTNLDKDTNYSVEVIASTSNESRENSLSFITAGANDQGQLEGNQDQTEDDQNQAQDDQDQNVDIMAGAWDSEKAYTKGEKVVVNGVTYEAQWWTKGENPTNSGEWGVWRVTEGQSSDQTSDQLTDQDTDDTKSSGSWSSNTVYTKGDQVSYNGKTYTAKWWTQGDKPSNGGPWDTPYVAGAVWNVDEEYSGGQTVTLNGSTYKAKWWTSGDNPKDGGVWEKL